MNNEIINYVFQNSSEINWYSIIENFLFPIVIALVTYLLVDRLGEYKKRKTYSKLGVAIMRIFTRRNKNWNIIDESCPGRCREPKYYLPPHAIPPKKSWNGMSTIPDEVLLRIIETAEKQEIVSFPLRECRIHCKNYFEHICENFEQRLNESILLSEQRGNWRQGIIWLLSDDHSDHIEASEKVYQMLEQAKQLLDKNSRALFQNSSIIPK